MNSITADELEPELMQDLPRRVRLSSVAFFWLSVNFIGATIGMTVAFLGLMDVTATRNLFFWVLVATFGMGGISLFALALRRARHDYLLARNGIAQRALITNSKMEVHGKATVQILFLSRPVGSQNLRKHERVQIGAQEGKSFLGGGDNVTLLYNPAAPDDFVLYPYCWFRVVAVKQ